MTLVPPACLACVDVILSTRQGITGRGEGGAAGAGVAKRGRGWRSPRTRSSICKAAFFGRLAALEARLDLASGTRPLSLRTSCISVTASLTRDDQGPACLRHDAAPTSGQGMKEPQTDGEGINKPQPSGQDVIEPQTSGKGMDEPHSCEHEGTREDALGRLDGTSRHEGGTVAGDEALQDYGGLKRRTLYWQLWSHLRREGAPFQGWLLKPPALEAFTLSDM